MPHDFDSNYLFRLIYSFHMPLFMFISGYVSLYSQEPSLKNIGRKAKALLLPYISWSIINFFIFHHDISFYEYQKMVIAQPDYSLWFLYVLFFNHLAFYLLSKIPSHKTSWIGAFLSLPIMFLPFHSFGFNLFKWYFFFYIIGRLANEYKDKLKLNSALTFFISAPLFFFMSYYWQRTTPIQLSFLAPVSPFIYKILVPCLGIITTFSLFRTINLHSKLLSQTIGTKTLEIYCTHTLFLFICISLFKNQVNIWIAIFLTFIISLFCSLLLSVGIKQSKLLSLFLFGK